MLATDHLITRQAIWRRHTIIACQEPAAATAAANRAAGAGGGQGRGARRAAARRSGADDLRCTFTTMLDDIRLDDGARSDLGARRGWYSV